MIPDSFYEDEIREGFYVPSAIKQAWGAELTVLKEIDRVCNKHDIQYYAEYGTYLGAVRHGGIIPWDDDFDIGMKRADYEKFLKVWKQEMPEGFDVLSFHTHPEHTKFLANVVGKSRICFEEEHLTKFHGFPYIAGVDIFVLDNISTDSESEKRRVNISLYIISVADDIYDRKCSAVKKEEYIANIEKWCNEKVDRKLEGEELRAALYIIAEKQFGKFRPFESEELTQMMPSGLGLTAVMKKFPQSQYKNFIRIPFEDMMIPVPVEYNDVLSAKYGDYMELYKAGGAHGYPFYEKQQEDLYKTMELEVPEYKCSSNLKLINDNSINNLPSDCYKSTLLECVSELIRMSEGINEAIDISDIETICTLLADSQQLAVDMGNYIEGVKGEGYDLIHELEAYCEKLFALYDFATGTGINSGNVFVAKGLLQEISNQINSVTEFINRRKEVVFLPFKSEYWKSFEQMYSEAKADPDTDVYVVPISYYYKKWDNTLRDEQYDLSKYPDELNCIKYDEFNFEIHHPDVIVIQNPYDEWNNVTSVNPYFYSANLKNFTDKLVYIPWFRLKEFNKSDVREYKNMKYYCNVPGVINADEVIVQSENMRNNYIDKLTEFAGEDTHVVWENKISVAKDCENISVQDFNEESCESKKMVMYYNELHSFFENGSSVIDKINRVINIFNEVENVTLVWKENPRLKEIEKYDAELYRRYNDLVNDFKNSKTGIYAAGEESDKYFDLCDAYYGDAGVIAHIFRNAGKKVMLQKCDI